MQMQMQFAQAPIGRPFHWIGGDGKPQNPTELVKTDAGHAAVIGAAIPIPVPPDRLVEVQLSWLEQFKMWLATL